MDECTYRLLDVAIKLGAVIVALLGATVGLFQYRSSQAQAQAKLWMERKSLQFTYSKAKSELFAQAARAAATMATSSSAPDVQKAIEEFWLLYWGPLTLIEGPEVEAAMVSIGLILDVVGTRLPESSVGTRQDLKLAAYALGQACRTEVDAIGKELEYGSRREA